MAKKKTFYKSKITVEVVASEPIDFETLSELAQQITEGDWVGDYTIESHEPITAKEAAQSAIKLNSDPEFLGIDEDGCVLCN